MPGAFMYMDLGTVLWSVYGMSKLQEQISKNRWTCSMLKTELIQCDES